MKLPLTALRGEIDSSTITVGDCKAPFSVMDRRTRGEKKINKQIEDLNNAVDPTEPKRHTKHVIQQQQST